MELQFDRIDFEIMANLVRDAQLSHKELGGLVGLAPSTIHARLKRLRELGVLRGSHADVDPVAFGYDLQAMVSIRLGAKTRSAVEAMTAHLLAMPEVQAVYHMAGMDDFLVHVVVRDTRHLQDTVADNITSHDDVTHIHTALVFEHVRSRVPPWVNELASATE